MIAAAIFVATAYSYGCGATGLTRIESKPVPYFTVAVDPTIIPLGTALELDASYLMRGEKRLWRAEDTGGDIVGNRIDIMMGTCEQANWWGRREVVVRVRGDLGWQNRLSTRSAVIAERLVSIRGFANLRVRLSSVSVAEARAVKHSRILRLPYADTEGAFRPSLVHGGPSSLLEWAAWVSQ
jgi:3D (Asp-Asp-Asp) domain-containing protein